MQFGKVFDIIVLLLFNLYDPYSKYFPSLVELLSNSKWTLQKEKIIIQLSFACQRLKPQKKVGLKEINTCYNKQNKKIMFFIFFKLFFL